jgi:hypothetical protein
MTIHTRYIHLFYVVFLSLVVTSLTGCTSEKESQSTTAFDHTHGANVTDFRKHTFEHKFADQCVARELKNSVNQTYDKKRLEKTCLCIATDMMKKLTATEAEKFLVENKSTRSLQIRFDNAAFKCLQKIKLPQAPEIYKKQ